MKKYLLTIYLLIQAIFVCASTLPELEVMDGFELKNYLGKWYEIARFDVSFEKKCTKPITAEYLWENNQLLVVNKCKRKNGDLNIATGIARFLYEDDIGKLEVTFVPKWLRFVNFVWGDYWILYTDYKYSLVGSPNRKYLWILSRTEKTDKKEIEKLIDIAKEQKFDITKLKFNY